MPDVHLEKSQYFADLGTLRNQIKVSRAQKPSASIKINLFYQADWVELTMRLNDLYIVAFKGENQEFNVGEICGENYNHLGMPAKMTIADLKRICVLGKFRKGMNLETQLITFAAIAVSEAARYSGVSMHIQGLLSGTFTDISLAALNKKYFTMWSDHSERVKSGKFIPGEQIQVDVLL